MTRPDWSKLSADDWITVAGTVLVTLGCAGIDWRAGAIVAGAVLLYVALFWIPREADRTRRHERE